MNMRKFIPESIKDHYRLLKNQKRFGTNVLSCTIQSNVTLGNDIYIAPNVDLRKNVKIGAYSYVNKGTLIASGEIGKYCSIGYNCQIGIFEHPINFISTSPHIYRHNSISDEFKPNWSNDDINNPPIIGNDVWIGSNAIIMQGTKIGDGSIIAAGAVVTKNVEPYTIVGGVPARIIKKRFSEDTIELLLNFKWWNKSDEWIKENINKFLKAEDFIKFIQN